MHWIQNQPRKLSTQNTMTLQLTWSVGGLVRHGNAVFFSFYACFLPSCSYRTRSTSPGNFKPPTEKNRHSDFLPYVAQPPRVCLAPPPAFSTCCSSPPFFPSYLCLKTKSHVTAGLPLARHQYGVFQGRRLGRPELAATRYCGRRRRALPFGSGSRGRRPLCRRGALPPLQQHAPPPDLRQVRPERRLRFLRWPRFWAVGAWQDGAGLGPGLLALFVCRFLPGGGRIKDPKRKGSRIP